MIHMELSYVIYAIYIIHPDSDPVLHDMMSMEVPDYCDMCPDDVGRVGV